MRAFRIGVLILLILFLLAFGLLFYQDRSLEDGVWTILFGLAVLGWIGSMTDG